MPDNDLSDLESAFSMMPNPRAITAAAVGSNPDKAAEAVNLGKQTGVNPAAINIDLDRFKAQVNTRAAGDIVQNNPKLRDYVISDPMKAKVSSDDLANLDAYSKAASSVPKGGFFSTVADAWNEAAGGKVDPKEAQRLADLSDSPYWKSFVNNSIVPDVDNLTGLFALPGQALNAGIAGLAYGYKASGAEAAGAKIGLGTAEQLQRDLGGMVENEMFRTGGEAGGHVAAAEMAPYIKAARAPERGKFPEIDKVRDKVADEKVDAIKQAFSDAQSSATRERVPEFFKDFAEQHHGDDTIGISADVVQALYGDKVPTSDDGILGFVPDMANQLEVAKATGADVKVPIADLMANATPEVFHSIEGGVRVDPETLTKFEKDALPPESGAESNYPAGNVTKQAGFFNYRDAEHPAAPEWHAPLQKIVDDLAEKFGLPVTPKVWTAYGPDTHFGYASSTGHIVLNEKLDPKLAVATTLHELGHQVEFQRFRDVGPEVQTSVRDAWRREFGKEETVGQNRPLSVPEDAHGIRIENTSVTHQNYLRSFPEWFAEQVQRWATKTEEPTGVVEKFFKGISDVWKEIYAKVTGHVDVVPEIKDFIKGIWQGNKAGFDSPIEPFPIPKRETIAARPEEIRIFKDPRAIGMNKGQWNLYQKAIEAQNKAEYESRLKKGMAEEKKRMAPEWAAKLAAIRSKIVDEMKEMPRFIADQWLSSGEFKIASDALTDEQKAVLPRSYYGKDGHLPDQIARYTGHTSGQALIDDLTALHANRGKMQPMEYTRRIADQLAARRMEEEHGTFKDAVEAVTKQRIVPATALDSMAAELKAMAEEHGFDLPLSREEIEGATRDKFNNTPLSMIDSDNILAAINRLNNKIEDKLLHEDPKAAFADRQRKFLASIMANRALEIEATKAKFDKQMKKFKERVIGDPGKPTVRQEYTDQIHAIMDRLGLPIKRDAADITSNMDKAGYGGLQDFLQQKINDGHQIPIPGFLLDPAWKENMSSIKAGEFEQLADFMKAMEKNGRDEQKIIVAGEHFDREVVAQELIAAARSVKAKPNDYPATPKKPGLREQLSARVMSAVNIESICRRLDHGDFDGPFTKYVARPLIAAANAEDRAIKQIAKELNEIGDFKDLHQEVENRLFPRPDGEPGFMKMTRNNVIAVLANMGNADNFARMVEGWKVDAGEVQAWVRKNTTAEDWEKMQKIGDIFERLFNQADRMSYDLSEVGIKKLKLGVVDNPHGADVKGWYNPIAYDRRAIKTPKIGEDRLPTEITPSGAQGMERFQSTTDQRYAKDRTNYRGNVLLDTSVIPLRMKQMAHDIAMRPAIIEANKIVNDRRVLASVAAHYSDQAADMFKPWVRDLAGSSDADPVVLSQADGLIHTLLRNTAAAEIGFNVTTIAKHGLTALSNSALQVGPLRFLEAVLTAGSEGPIKGKTWRQFAMDCSDELARRSRLTPEALQTSHGLKFPGADATPWGKAKELGQNFSEWGTAGVAYSDLASAVPTWLAEYKRQIAADPAAVGRAIELADKAVRDAHGSSALTNKPEVMRSSNPFDKATTQFYGFFNEMFQKLYEMNWRVQDAWGGDAIGVKNATDNSTRAANIFTRMIVAGLVEETVSGGGDPQEGIMSRAVKGTLHAFGSTLPIIRDIVQAIYSGHDPEGSLITAGLKSFTDIGRDVTSKKAWTKPWAAQFEKHMAFFGSEVTGLPINHLAKAGQFLYGIHANTEHPADLGGVIRGLSHGTLQRRH